MDQLLYIGGAAAGGIALIAALIIFLLYRLKLASLNVKLDNEYGRRKDGTHTD